MATFYEDRWNPNSPKKRLRKTSYAAIDGMIEKMVSVAIEPKGMCEVLKGKFGNSNPSSSLSWAQGDLRAAMTDMEDDAPGYLAALWDAISYLAEHEDVPDQDYINSILTKNGESFRLDGDQLLENSGDIEVTNEAMDLPSFSAKYRLKEQIGEGGFGVVHRVEKTTEYGTFQFAAKFFDPSVFNVGPNGAARFKREVLALNRLQHRGIVTILEGGIASDDRPYYLMPLIEGVDIRSALEGQSMQEVAAQFASVCQAIEFAHGQGIFHRDLKPSNVLIRRSDGQAIIVDFGAAFLLDNLDEKSLTLVNVGSPGYIPQEVVNNPKLRSPQHDVYSLGVTLYETLARHRPDLDDYKKLSDINSSYDVFDPIIEQAIAPAPDRYAEMRQMREAIERVLRSLTDVTT